MSVRLIPNSHGTALREHNPCHEPAGSQKGGQFAPKGAGNCQAGTSTAVADDPMSKPAGHNIQGISNHADDYAIREVFGRFDVEEIAENMVRGTKVKWSVEISSDGGEDEDAYDEDTLRELYDQYVEEERDNALDRWSDDQYQNYSRQVQKALDNTETLHGEIGKIYDEVVQERRGEGKYGDTSKVKYLPDMERDDDPFDASDMEELVVDAYQKLQANRTQRFGSDEAFTLRRELTSGEREMLREMFVQHASTARWGAAWPDFDEDVAKRRHEYFDENDGLDKWRDDGNEDSFDDGDYLQSFDTWVSNNGYNVRDSSGGAAKVKFEFHGENGEQLTRTFDRDDGDLHVHHDYFTVASGSPLGLGKEVFRGLVNEYERIGVDRISVYANIDVGQYAWAKYGFTPTDPYGMKRTFERKIEGFSVGKTISYTERSTRGKPGQTVSVVVTQKHREALQKLLNMGGQSYLSDRAFWALTDARLNGTDGNGKPAKFSVGKWLLLNGDSWNGEFSFSNDAQVARLKKYLGLKG